MARRIIAALFSRARICFRMVCILERRRTALSDDWVCEGRTFAEGGFEGLVGELLGSGERRGGSR